MVGYLEGSSRSTRETTTFHHSIAKETKHRCLVHRKIVFLVKLTVPHEDNNKAGEFRKNDRYGELLENCEGVG